jgi:DNA polymerase III gamma/tau subunit
MARIMPKPAEVLDLPDGHIEELKQQVRDVSPEDLQRLVSILIDAEGDILRSGSPKVGLEVTLIRMARLARLQPLEHILEKLEALERNLTHPDTPGSSPQTPPPPLGGKANQKAGEAALSRPATPGPPPGNPPLARWEQFLEAARSEREPLGGSLESVLSWEVAPDAVKVYCPEGSFHYHRLRQPDVTEFLTKIAKRCFGDEKVFLACPVPQEGRHPTVSTPEGETPHSSTVIDESAKQTSSTEEEGTMSPAVKAALEVFGGTITEVKRLYPDRKS